MKVECICIDAKNRPSEVPLNMWISEGIQYTIVHIYRLSLQNNILAVELEEVKIKGCEPYEFYRLDRFAFTEESFKKLIELMKACSELNDINIQEIVKDLELIEK